MTASTRDSVIAAARELFARRGYTATTIKDIAAAAGCSPALVMKLTGSKAELFALADPSAAVLEETPAAEEPPVAQEPIGHQLVRRVVDRRDHDEPEPMVMAPLLIHEAADREATRADIERRYVAAMAERIGDTTAERVSAQLVLATLIGLAGAVRTLGILGPSSIDREALIERYGALVQRLVDETST